MSAAPKVSPQEQSEILMQALPHMLRYDDSTIVVKYGGHAMGGEGERDFARDMVLLEQSGVNPVVVHGGGPQIKAMLDRLQIRSSFVDGLRVTDAATVEVVEMVLAGKINKEIVTAIQAAGGKAVGISGKDGRLIEALIYADEDYIPVIAPIGVAEDGQTYNINADTVAGALAGALNAKRMLLMTDVPGVLDANGDLIRQLTVGEAREAIASGVATGGMIPKLETAIAAVEAGVEAVVILDGRRPHAMLTELFTEHGAGTLVRA